MKKPSFTRSLIALLLFSSPYYLFAAPGNDGCGSALSITPSTGTCTGITGTVASSTLDGASSTCQGTAKYDVWYKFVAGTNNPTISLSGLGVNFTNPGLQVLTGCGGTVLACGGTSITPSGLTVGATYYIRIFSTSTTIPTSSAGFTLCVLDPAPANDNCGNATLITSATTCITGTSNITGQTLYAATGDGGTITSVCTAVNSQDVWYKFVAQSVYPTVTVNNLGGSWGTKLKLQLLSGSCAGFTE